MSETQSNVPDSDVPTGNGEVQQVNDAVDVQPANAVQPAQQPRGGTWSMVKGFAIRLLVIYLISSLFRRSTTPPAATNQDGSPAAPPLVGVNLFPKGVLMDLYVYVNEENEFSDFNNPDALFWVKKGLRYGDWESGPDQDGSYIYHGQIIASQKMQSNGSVYLHAYIVKEGRSPNPEDKKSKKYSVKDTALRSKMINKYRKRRFHTSLNLLTGQTDVHPDLIKKENSSSYEILSFWHPNLTINILDDHSPWMKGQIPQPLDEYIEFLPGTNKYYPVIYLNDYWNLNSDYMPINETTKVLNLTITVSPISLFRWQMYAAQGMKNKWYSMLGSMDESDEDQDSLKTTLVETNPYLLGMTIIVSIVHSVFEFLAFKNDIQFWRSRKSLEGLSVRSVFFNVFQSLVVVLYVMDQETNMVVRISVCVGLLIEIWKIMKVVDVKIDRENRWFDVIPRITFDDKSTYTQSATKKYDMLAFKYLSWGLFPLLAGYAVYSLLYVEHKGWYSWVLSMMYGFLLTFGFIMMTPQLFINYKLKSVAHLPWRMLTYKFLNTFIDDIFAFVIKMPTLYRIGCFRDDIVFLIFLYQRWIYRVDPKRVNEFGVSQEMLDEAKNGQVVPAVEAAEAENADAVDKDGADADTKNAEAVSTNSADVDVENDEAVKTEDDVTNVKAEDVNDDDEGVGDEQKEKTLTEKKTD